MSVPHETTPTGAPTAAPVVSRRGPDPDDATPRVDPADAAEDRASEDVMRLLSEHVPLTLLADLAQPKGPKSPEILEDEGLPDVAWWQPEDEAH